MRIAPRRAEGTREGELPSRACFEAPHDADLLEPEDVVPAWKRWSPILLRPEGLYGTRPVEGRNKAVKLKAIREALRSAKRVWLATDCDREGQLIGQEILEHYQYRGQIMRVAVHRPGFADDPRRIRQGEAQLRICQPLRRRCRASAGRPDLQPVADPNRDGHSGPRGEGCDRGWPGKDADLGNRVQARVGNPELRAAGLF